MDGEVLGFSVSYKINETYSVGIDYSFIDYDSASLEGTSVSFEESQINFGLLFCLGIHAILLYRKFRWNLYIVDKTQPSV